MRRNTAPRSSRRGAIAIVKTKIIEIERLKKANPAFLNESIPVALVAELMALYKKKPFARRPRAMRARDATPNKRAARRPRTSDRENAMATATMRASPHAEASSEMNASRASLKIEGLLATRETARKASRTSNQPVIHNAGDASKRVRDQEPNRLLSLSSSTIVAYTARTTARKASRSDASTRSEPASPSSLAVLEANSDSALSESAKREDLIADIAENSLPLLADSMRLENSSAESERSAREEEVEKALKGNSRSSITREMRSSAGPEVGEEIPMDRSSSRDARAEALPELSEAKS